jgi:fructoselysine-6-P-deglycase FrlB-like protein
VARLLDEAAGVVLFGTGASLAMGRAAEPLLVAADRRAGQGRRLMALEASTIVMAPSDELSWGPGDCAVAVSKSGASPEVLGAARRARGSGARLIAVTATEASALAGLADELVLVRIAEEHGAATQSALGTLAALLAMWDVVGRDRTASRGLIALLRATVHDWDPVQTLGVELARLQRIWMAGFGSGLGIAEAAGLLWHEKAGRPAVSATPSAFRHGEIEAARDGAGIVVVEIEPPSPARHTYMELLASECRAASVEQLWLSHDEPPADRWLALRGDDAPQRVLEALMRVQQLARATAHAAGTYRDGFAILTSLVHTAREFE